MTIKQSILAFCRRSSKFISLTMIVLLVPIFALDGATLVDRLRGQVLLQVESHGEAWYVYPIDGMRYYLKDGAAAYEVMRKLGLGIAESDYNRLAAGSASLRSRLMGRIVLRVAAHGEAYYLCPRTGVLSYLRDGEAAYNLLRSCGLGIANVDLEHIHIAPNSALPPGVVLPSTGGGSGVSPMLSGCPVFPSNSPWNTDISKAKVHANSATYINSIGTTKKLHVDFGETREYGIPYNLADNDTKKYPITFVDYGDESDTGPYPIPARPEIEAASDSHLLVINTDECKLYELYGAALNAKGISGWSASSGAIWDLRSNALRPYGWTSADAAGLPIFPGLVRYDEVMAGEINHAIRFTASSTQRAYILPATHYAGSVNASLPPMGLRVRLKANYDISTLPPQAKIIATAMKKYGMILADNGTSWHFQGAWSPGWHDDELRTLQDIPGSAFEAVETGSIIR